MKKVINYRFTRIFMEKYADFHNYSISATPQLEEVFNAKRFTFDDESQIKLAKLAIKLPKEYFCEAFKIECERKSDLFRKTNINVEDPDCHWAEQDCITEINADAFLSSTSMGDVINVDGTLKVLTMTDWADFDA